MAQIKAPAFAARVPPLVWLRSRLVDGKPLPITAEELANLRDHRATPALKQHLESLSESDQRQFLTTLMKRLLDWHFANHRFGQSWLAVGDNELAQFLENLDPEQRDKLLRLPNDEMQRELVVRYWRWKLSEELPWLIFPHHGRKAASPSGGLHPDVKKADPAATSPARAKANRRPSPTTARKSRPPPVATSRRPPTRPLLPGKGRGEGNLLGTNNCRRRAPGVAAGANPSSSQLAKSDGLYCFPECHRWTYGIYGTYGTKWDL